eukprot:TRINITY_DN2658_c2_g1_i1.p1 TRINITY_DN2658_c2_g1~~TRINITY_DN2658_c2_g1_i1.p1  ORF type:complete len:608 (+),score=89.46 TRINITY_DN2658_c2_g1_i1:79-1824(+)
MLLLAALLVAAAARPAAVAPAAGPATAGAPSPFGVPGAVQAAGFTWLVSPSGLYTYDAASGTTSGPHDLELPRPGPSVGGWAGCRAAPLGVTNAVVACPTGHTRLACASGVCVATAAHLAGSLLEPVDAVEVTGAGARLKLRVRTSSGGVWGAEMPLSGTVPPLVPIAGAGRGRRSARKRSSAPVKRIPRFGPRWAEKEGASWFHFLVLSRPSAAAIAALNEGAAEDAETVAYAKAVCGNFSWPLRDLSGKAAPDLYWGMLHNSEKEVLQMALYEMRGLVKAMVIVESNVTQTGSPRRLRGQSYYEQFSAPGSPRVVHQTYEEPSRCLDKAARCHPLKYGNLHLSRERSMRNVGLLAGWKKAGVRPDDMVVISDADEFVHSRFLYALRRCAWNDPRARADVNVNCDGRPTAGARISFFNSYFNCPSKQWYWHPNAITFKCMLNGTEPRFGVHESPTTARWTADDLRSAYTRPGTQTMQIAGFIAGWHLRNFFSPDAEQTKYRTYGHPRNESLQLIQDRRRLECKVDPWDRGPVPVGLRAPVMHVRPEDLPLMAQRYPRRFAHFFYRPEGSTFTFPAARQRQ